MSETNIAVIEQARELPSAGVAPSSPQPRIRDADAAAADPPERRAEHEPPPSTSGASRARDEHDAATLAEPGPPDRHGAAPGTSVGVCVEGEHSPLRGRSRIRWRDARGARHEASVPRLRGLHLNRGDRVLLSHPSNHDEPIIVGVLDGLGRRTAEPLADDGPLVRLGSGEALRVAATDGTPILEVKGTDTGPEVRLLTQAAGVDVPGTFRVRADEIELEARTGEVRVSAAGDVKVAGEVVRLN